MKEGKRRGKEAEGGKKKEGGAGREARGRGWEAAIKIKKFIPSIIMVATDLHQEPSNHT